MMQDIQNYLKRLVINEGNFAEQVEDKRARYNMTERLEGLDDELVKVDDDTEAVEYEDEDELAGDLMNDDE